MSEVVFKWFYFLALVLLLNVSNTLGRRSFKIVFARFDFEANSKLMDVKIQVNNESESSLSVDANILEVLNDIELTISVFLETAPGSYTVLVSKSRNLCKILKERKSEPMARMIYQDMLRYGNFVKECPIEKGSLRLHNYHVNEDMLPSFIPETNFKFIIQMNKPKGIRIFKGTLYGKIDKSKVLNNVKTFGRG